MASVLDRPTDTVPEPRASDRTGGPRAPRGRRSRSGGRSVILAVLLLGLVLGAAVVLLTDSSDPSQPAVSATPSGGSGSTASAAGATSASSNAGVTDVNGQHVHGVKAGDIAAEAQPDVPLDAPTRELLASQ